MQDDYDQGDYGQDSYDQDGYAQEDNDEEDRSSFYSSAGSQSFRAEGDDVYEDQAEEEYTSDQEEMDESLEYEPHIGSSEVLQDHEVMN